MTGNIMTGNIIEIRNKYKEKIEAKTIGNIKDELFGSLDALCEIGDFYQSHKVASQIASLEEIVSDYIDLCIEKEINLDDALLNEGS